MTTEYHGVFGHKITIESRWTYAAESRGSVIDASAAFRTKIQSTLAHLDPAIGSGESGCASTMKRVDAVDASASVSTSLISAVVGIALAVLPFESFFAHTRVRLHRIQASCAVLARIRVAWKCFSC